MAASVRRCRLARSCRPQITACVSVCVCVRVLSRMLACGWETRCVLHCSGLGSAACPRSPELKACTRPCVTFQTARAQLLACSVTSGSLPTVARPVIPGPTFSSHGRVIQPHGGRRAAGVVRLVWLQHVPQALHVLHYRRRCARHAYALPRLHRHTRAAARLLDRATPRAVLPQRLGHVGRGWRVLRGLLAQLHHRPLRAHVPHSHTAIHRCGATGKWRHDDPAPHSGGAGGAGGGPLWIRPSRPRL